MIHNAQIFEAFISFLGFAALLGFLYGPWQRLVVDIIRQQLFELRDKAFDRAANGDLSFDSVEYVAYRDAINSMIRNAHASTIWRHIAYAIVCKGQAKDISATMINTISGGNPEHILKKKFNRACGWLMLMLWLRSPLLMAVTIVLSAALPIVAMMVAISARVRREIKLAGVAMRHQIQRDAALSMGHEADCVVA